MFRYRRLVVALSMALVATTSCTQQPGQERRYAYDIHFDLRDEPLPPDFVISPKELDRFVHSEPDGLRSTLPNGRDDLTRVAIGTRFGVEGDFDITATLEILAAEQPAEGFGAGVTLFINKVDRHYEGATLGRLLRSGGKDVVLWDHVLGKPGPERTFDADTRPCTDQRFRMRLKRTGGRLSYALAKGLEGAAFEELPAKHFGNDGVNQIVVIVTTGNQPVGVDVRWIDLRVLCDGIRGPMPAVAVQTAGPSRAWLLAGSLVSVLLLLLVAGVDLRERRGPGCSGAAYRRAAGPG